MHKFHQFVIAAVAALPFFVGTGAQAQNLLTNGNFGTGDTSGWTLSNNSGYFNVSPSGSAGNFPAVPDQNAYFVYDGAVGSDMMLSQSFADTSGQTYKVSGWFVAPSGTTPSDYGMGVGSGQPQVYVTNANTNSQWVNYSFDFTGTGVDTLDSFQSQRSKLERSRRLFRHPNGCATSCSRRWFAQLSFHAFRWGQG